MRSFYAILLTGMCIFSLKTQAAWDIYKSGISVNAAFHDCQWASVAPDFQGAYFGRFITGGSLPLNFGEVLTFKNGASDVCSATMFYRVYRTCDSAPGFTSLSLPFCCNFGGTDCSGGACGPDVNNAGDQKWFANSGGVNLLTGLSLPGTYVIEVYFNITGSDSGGCAQTKFSSNGGNNFRAYFELNNNDSFADGQFSSSPTWTGDNANFTVATKSDAAGLIGTELNNSYALRLNAPLSNGSEYLSTVITTWNSQQEWFFWTGRRNQAATVLDQTIVWLYANESTLESGTVDGYRLVIGDDVGNDEIRLQSVTNGTGTDIFVTTASIPNGIVDWGVTFRVTRSTAGRWTIRTSTLPTITGSGATALSCPEVLSTVLQLNSINGQTYADNTDATPSGTGYIGVVAAHGSSANAAAGQEFDNFRLLALGPDTSINYTAASATINENLGGGTYVLTIAINNPSATVATTADVVLTSGSAARVNGYTTQTITFPAGSSSTQTVVLTITDNNVCDGTANLTFSLQNIAGGTNAFAGSPAAFALSIVDDNTGYDTILSDNFEDGNITGWTPVVFSGSSGTWTASTASPITGAYSIRHTNSGAAGATYVHTDVDDAVLPGVETTWRFNLRTFVLEPSPANKWQVFLAASESNLWGSSVDGYALGIDPLLSGDPDILTLWRVDNGVMTSAIVTADIADVIYDWGIAQDIVGFEIVRSASGTWTLRVDANGGFDALSIIGTGSETTYNDMGFFGARFIHTASNGGKLAMDDITITQTGCRELYYSRSSGNFSAGIWSTQPSGLPNPGVIESGRWTRLIIQNTHTVALNINAVCDDFSINSGAVVTGGTSTLKVFGDWLNAGTFTANTGTIVLKGDESPGQNVLGASTTRFHNLTIDNSFGTVNLLSATEAAGVVSPEEGTLQTGGNLTLISNVSGSGSIGRILTGASVSGNVTLQRYIPTGTSGWVFLGSPIVGQTINGAWNDDLVTTGFAGSDFPPPGYTFNNIQRYDESQPGGRNVGWVPATNVTNALSTTFGYNVYMTSAAQNVDVTGSIQSGNLGVAVPFTNNANAADGWNLMMNVYPSEVDWYALEGNSNDFATYYVYDSALPGYRTHNANSQVGSASRYIPHSQSFFVRATTFGQTLNFQESQKTATNAAFERSAEDSKFISFRLERAGLADEAIVTFVEGATDAFEFTYDAEKWESLSTTSPEMALVSSDDTLLTIDARPVLTSGVSIPVHMDLPAAGTYSFLIQEVQNLDAGVCMMIEDLFTGQTITAEAGSQISITITEPFNGNRLMIHFTAAAQISPIDATCFGLNNGQVLMTSAAGTWNFTLLDGAGIPAGSGSSLESIDNLAAGAYSLELTNSDATCGAASFDFTIAEPVAVTAWSGSVKDDCNAMGNGSIEFGVNGIDTYSYTLTNTSNVIVSQGTTSDFALAMENLSADVYTIIVESTCGTLTRTEDLRDPQSVSAAIITSSPSIDITEGSTGLITFEASASNADSFEWTMNNAVIGSNQIISHPFTSAGTYTVNLTASNASCSATSAVNVVVNQVVNVAEAVVAAPVTMIQANGGIQLAFSGVNSRKADIRLINALGQIVVNERATPRDGQQVFISLEELSAGAYTVQVIADGKDLFSRQIVK